MKAVSLEEKRKEKQPLCDYCGEPDHKTAFQCPRIKRITYHEDGDVTLSFSEVPLTILTTNNTT